MGEGGGGGEPGSLPLEIGALPLYDGNGTVFAVMTRAFSTQNVLELKPLQIFVVPNCMADVLAAQLGSLVWDVSELRSVDGLLLLLFVLLVVVGFLFFFNLCPPPPPPPPQ